MDIYCQFVLRVCNPRSLTNEPTMSDAFLAFVNDPIFDPTDNMAFEDAHLRVVEGIERQPICADYVRGYVTGVTM